MYLKCYFKTKGRFQTKIIYSPASHTNVYSDVKGIRGIFANVYSRYQQALRHMWGSLDSGYAVRKGIEALFRRNDEKLASWLSSSALVSFVWPLLLLPMTNMHLVRKKESHDGSTIPTSPTLHRQTFTNLPLIQAELASPFLSYVSCTTACTRRIFYRRT